MGLRIHAVVLDTTEPEGLATFWSELTGRPAKRHSNGYMILPDPGRREPLLIIQRVPESKSVKNRMHIDLESQDLDAERARAVGLGASEVHDYRKDGKDWIAMADPQGNEFCLCACD